MPGRSSIADRLRSGNDRWTLEARRALLLAEELRTPLELDTLVAFDMRDLLALQAVLRDRLAVVARGWRRYAGRLFP